MRYAIVTDIHANRQAWSSVLKDIKRQSVDSIICLGDVIGYGPAPAEVLESVYEHADHFVLGNHDAVIANKLDSGLFNDNAKYLIEWTREQLSDGPAEEFFGDLPLKIEGDTFACAHAEAALPGRFGYLYEPDDCKESFESLNQQVLFVGHTHHPLSFTYTPNHKKIFKNKPKDFTLDPRLKYIVNAGSVGDPRDGGTKATYCIYDEVTGEISYRFIDFDLEGFRADLKAVQLPITPFFLMNYDNKVQEAETIKDMAQIEASAVAAAETGSVKLGEAPRKKFKFDNHSHRLTHRSASRRSSSKSNVMAVTVIILLLLAIGGVLLMPKKKPLEKAEKVKPKAIVPVKPKAKIVKLPYQSNRFVANNGFEKGTLSWVARYSPKTSLDNEIKKEGILSLKFSAKDSESWVQQKVKLKKGSKYRLSGLIKTEDLSGEESARGASIKLEGYDATFPAVKGTVDWRVYNTEFVALNEQATIQCIIGDGGKMSGTAWFDNIQLEELIEEKKAVIAVSDNKIIPKREFKLLTFKPAGKHGFFETLFEKGVSFSKGSENKKYHEQENVIFAAKKVDIWNPLEPANYSASKGVLVLMPNLYFKQAVPSGAAEYRLIYRLPMKSITAFKLEIPAGVDTSISQVKAEIMNAGKSSPLKLLSTSSKPGAEGIVHTLAKAGTWNIPAAKSTVEACYFTQRTELKPTSYLVLTVTSSGTAGLRAFRVAACDNESIFKGSLGDFYKFSAAKSAKDNIVRFKVNPSLLGKDATLKIKASKTVKVDYSFGKAMPKNFMPLPYRDDGTLSITKKLTANDTYIYLNFGKELSSFTLNGLELRLKGTFADLADYRLPLKRSKSNIDFESSLKASEAALTMMKGQAELTFKNFKSKSLYKKNTSNLVLIAQKINSRYSIHPLRSDFSALLNYVQSKKSTGHPLVKFYMELLKYAKAEDIKEEQRQALIKASHEIFKNSKTLLSMSIKSILPGAARTGSLSGALSSAKNSTTNSAASADPSSISKIYPTLKELKESVPYSYKFITKAGCNGFWGHKTGNGKKLNDGIFAPAVANDPAFKHSKHFVGFINSNAIIRFNIHPERDLRNGVIIRLYGYKDGEVMMHKTTKFWKLFMGEQESELVDVTKKMIYKPVETTPVQRNSGAQFICYELHVRYKANSMEDRKTRFFQVQFPVSNKKHGIVLSEIVIHPK